MRNARAVIERRLLDPAFLQSILRHALVAFTVSLGVNVLLCLALVVEVMNRPHVRYIYHDSFGKPRELIVTDRPYFSDSEVMNWAVQKATNLYTMDYVHFAEHLNKAAGDFNVPAWNAWAESFKEPGNIEFIKAKKVFLTATPQSAASIRSEGIDSSGSYVWHVTFPMLLRWENASGSTTNLLAVSVTVQRTNDPLHPDGLMITSLDAPRAPGDGG